MVHALRECLGVFWVSMQLVALWLLSGMDLDAIVRIIWFAQVLSDLLYLGFQCLLQDLISLQAVLICYNWFHSRKCTLKIKYNAPYEIGRFKASKTLLGIET